MEGTRVGALANIEEWAENPNSTERVFWVKGSIGVGKSSIAYSAAQRAHENGHLGASFFFSRYEPQLRDPRLLFPTIAFQLAEHNPALRRAITSAITNDLDVSHREPKHQYDALIRRTISAIQHSEHPILFVFDGLDEFESTIASYSDTMCLFITDLSRLSSNVRILATSRPEPYIERIVRSVPPGYLKFIDLDKDTETKKDIVTFLRSGLSEIPTKLGRRLQLGANGCWFSEKQLNRLSWKAGRSFVYATTALRFIGDTVVGDPCTQLDMLLNTSPPSDGPESELDALYLLALQRAYPHNTSDNALKTLNSLLAVICIPPVAPIDGYGPRALIPLSYFAECGPDYAKACLLHLQSIICFHEDNFDDRFFVDEQMHGTRIAHLCIDVLTVIYADIDDTIAARCSFQPASFDLSCFSCNQTLLLAGYQFARFRPFLLSAVFC
ncbi:hypothetical protein HGRIS_009083 [Hohenbuehelia grisea]|uniref:NACHT domain-containing protein n=1 Tax=Hohenbuehelia grisea TaxID=104357 RepID=A0ABR3J0F4_9AGAR